MTTVVAGVDGSEPGWWALEWATEYAESAGSRLRIVRAYPGTGRVTDATLEFTDPVLTRHVAAARARLGGDRVDLLTPSGDPAPLLLAAGGDLLVVGAAEAPARVTPLSTARWVAAHAPCPVVVVRPTRGTGLFAGHVVVGVDGGEPARAALAFGFAHAAVRGIPVAAVHAAGTHDEDAGDVWVDDRFAETHLAPPPPALALLDAEVEPYARAHPSVPVKRAVWHGGAVPALLRAAAGARLLVVGDRGRAAPARLLLGSVSQGVVAHAAGPVAVAHATGPGRTGDAATLARNAAERQG
jgi:nucleotide-binding universal stress UspA family protein